MYRTCLHCLNELGENRRIDGLPVGRTLAFDPSRGRVWVICPACGRWNLAPEAGRVAIDSMEQLYREGGQRVARDTIGLCRLPDGLTLIRIGASSDDELAAWRYGTRMRGSGRESAARRFVKGVASLVAGTLLSPGVVGRWLVVHVLREPERQIPIRRTDLDGAHFRLTHDAGGLRVALERWKPGRTPELPLPIPEADAGVLLDRILVSINREGATPNTLRAALRYLERHGAALVGGLSDTSTTETSGILRVRYEGEGAWRGEWSVDGAAGFLPVPRHRTLALEMARQAEAERRAMEGELRAYAARWREADELARIADSI